MRYRFTEEDFIDFGTRNVLAEQRRARVAAEKANSLIEKWEAESEKLYQIPNTGNTWFPRDGYLADEATQVATLWNPKPLEEKNE